ncbi:MAG TPA: amidinotransferase, partial [Actinomycetes bacterium]|nr:amidinotransferase [Actinomycetes bacterium]
MCAPEHFRVDYAINPWMDPAAVVDVDLARAQWDRLVEVLEQAGARIERIAGRTDCPDMVYAMNYGLVDGDRVAMTTFRHHERAAEAEAAARWFADRGLRPAKIVVGAGTAFEAGDAFLFGDALLVSAGPRTDRAAHAELARRLDVRVVPVEIVHPAYYHLDLSFCPLDETKAIIAPGAWSP